jgi:hypothetical protein
MVSLGVWGRLAASLMLCAMLSVVLAVAGPSADAQVTAHPVDTQVTGHPAGSCIGTNACTGLAFGMVGAGSCVGSHACHDAAGPIGDDSCKVFFACVKAADQIRDGSCNGTTACYLSSGPIGDGSCNATSACYLSSGPIGAGSCLGYYECHKAVGPIGVPACAEGTPSNGPCSETTVPELGPSTCPASTDAGSDCFRSDDRIVNRGACSLDTTSEGDTWSGGGEPLVCIVTPNPPRAGYKCDATAGGVAVTTNYGGGLVSTCSYSPPYVDSCASYNIDPTNDLKCRVPVDPLPGAPFCAADFSLEMAGTVCVRYSNPAPAPAPVLAFTGATSTTLTFVALGLIGAGAMLAPAGRRRR